MLPVMQEEKLGDEVEGPVVTADVHEQPAESSGGGANRDGGEGAFQAVGFWTRFRREWSHPERTAWWESVPSKRARP